MKMDVNVKTEVNGGTPLPQRQQKNQQGAPNKNLKQNQPPQQRQQQQQQQQPPSDSGDGGPAEKKPRFSQGGQNNPGAGGNQNKGFGGKQGFGNRNRNRGGNQNRGNAQNQNQQNQQQQQQQQQQQDGKSQVVANNQDNQGNKKDNIGVGGPQQQQQQQQNQNQHRGGGNRGGGGGGQNRDRSRGGGRGGGGGAQSSSNNMGGRHEDFFISQRLRAIAGPTHELQPIENTEETKFSGRNRLYVGNLTNDVTEAELREMFKPYGEIGEIFSNPDKNFTFLKLDYHANAERAKRELDGTMRKGRMLRVRFAPNATILRVSNLTPFVSNELLYKAFEVFGPIERASVTVDDRGKATGEGVIEFAKKSSASACLRFCNDKCYFLTASLRPCLVEPFEINDDTDGLPEKSLNKKSPEFNHERNVGPRFADLGSFEHEYGTRWKQLHELYKTKQEALKRELKMEEEKLEAQMEYARYEHETELLRQELRKRESDNERKKMEWEMREKQAEEMRKRDEDNMRRAQNEMQSRMLRQEEEMRRRQQENTLFMQAQQLNSLLDQQEGGFSGNVGNFDGFGGNSPFEFRGNSGAGNSGNNNGPNNQQEPFTFEFGGNQNQSGGGGNQGNQRGGNNTSANNNNNPWERRRRF